MNLEEVIYKRRTIRRFKQDPISIDILKKLLDYARVAPMGNNIQSVEYIIVSEAETRKELFTCLAWAGALPPEMRTPEEDRRPMAYIVVLVNTNIKKAGDGEVGGAIQNILLGATNHGLGTCWMGAINREKIKKLLQLPDHYEVRFVVSLGYPDEESIMEPFEGSMKYWKDEDGKMHIPKKKLNDIIYKII
jgi:nitroreductase